MLRGNSSILKKIIAFLQIILPSFICNYLFPIKREKFGIENISNIRFLEILNLCLESVSKVKISLEKKPCKHNQKREKCLRSDLSQTSSSFKNMKLQTSYLIKILPLGKYQIFFLLTEI